jgi:thioredoxin-related protein
LSVISYQENAAMNDLLGYLGLLGVAVGLTACGTTATKEKPPMTEEEKAFGPTGIPPFLRATGASDTPGTTVAPGGNKRIPSGTRTPIKDIVFTTDEEKLPELAELLAAPKAKIWEESDTIARRRSSREGKPLLIWFTSSKFSPNCKALDQELFSREDFGKWATEKLVRLKVDATYQVRDLDLSIDDAENREIDAKHYAEKLKKRYRVMGHPTLVMLNPSGEVLGRWTGYKRGTSDFTWGLLKHAETVSTRAYSSWRADMEKRGYREWQDRIGRKIFAKLFSYDKGDLILIDPDGSRFHTQEDKLSDADRAWLTEQKEARHLP